MLGWARATLAGVDENALADAWVRDQLARAREAVRQHPPGPHDLTLEEYERRLRGRADAILKPTTTYIGMELERAKALAAEAGDRLCPHRGPTGHRGNWRADRVHVDMADDDRVVAAWRDPAPWRQR